jgi:hypothetical protein
MLPDTLWAFMEQTIDSTTNITINILFI